MIGEIAFMPVLKEFLRLNGVIYTVRKYRMVERDVGIWGVGTCRRVPLGEVSSKEDLLPYIQLSGFDSVEAWWTKIRHFTPDKESTLYLYKVEVKSDGWW